MGNLIDSYGARPEQLVFLSDGDTWIKHWAEYAYPGAILIFDYFHAGKHLYEFVNAYFGDKEQGQVWRRLQEGLLFSSKVELVIDNIHTLAGDKNEPVGKLMEYYRTNQNRMDYCKYRKVDCGIIGSGAIESAHRTVVQKRMKQSGQRWTKRGAQNMLNLRVTYMNEQWSKIIHLAKIEFKTIAALMLRFELHRASR